MRNKNIGSISSGTLRPQDLIPCFISEAKSQHLSRADRKELRKIASRVARVENGEFGESDAYWQDEVSSWDMEALVEMLNSVAPAYFYFGSHPGDGADFGYWLDPFFPESFDGLKVNDLSELANLPTPYTGEVLHVNDHGNQSLYRCVRGRLYEVWGLV
jgi:hypothetical protein